MSNKKQSKTTSTVTITIPSADSDKLLQQGYDLIQTGKAQDLQKAEECFEQAYKQGNNAEALTGLLILAGIYNSENTLSINGKELSWTAKIADNQKSYTLLLKIKEFLHGEDTLSGGLRLSDEFIQLGGVFEASGETANLQQALECYKIADTLGNAEGAFQYADVVNSYYEICGSKRHKRAETYYLRAAEHGNTKAMLSLARLYRCGHLKNWKETLFGYFKTIFFILLALFSFCFPIVIKLLYISLILQESRLVQSFLFYVKCDLLKTPYDASSLKAVLAEIQQLSIPFGKAFMTGYYLLLIALLFFLVYKLCTPRNKKSSQYIKCYKWLERAADAKDPIGMEQQAYCLFYGIGIKRNKNKAICLFEQAAKQNNFNALVFLGRAHEKGRSVSINLAKAKNYYEEARKQKIDSIVNEGRTLCWLGDAYKNGKCVLQDKEFARYCYDKASTMFSYDLYGLPLKVQIPARLRLWIKKSAQAEADFRRSEFEASQHRINVLTDKNGKLGIELDKLEKENRKKDQTIADQLQTITEQFQLNAQKDKLIAKQNQTITAQSQKIDTLQGMLTEYQNSLANVRSIWTKTESTIQNPEEFFATIEELSRIMAESHETEYEKAKNALQERFGEYWNRLQPASQISLISARTLYELSIQQNAGENFDYSGVCISATSALELELKKVFLTNYVKFAKKSVVSIDRWPESIRHWSSKKQTWLPKDKFVLGDLPNLLESRQGRASTLLNDYLQSILNLDSSQSNDPRYPLIKGSQKRASFLTRVDELRNNYRNPAGHGGTVNQKRAIGCCQEIMGSFEAETRLTAAESLLVELLSMLK